MKTAMAYKNISFRLYRDASMVSSATPEVGTITNTDLAFWEVNSGLEMRS